MIVTETFAQLIGTSGSCAVIFWGDEVVDAAPIVKFMKGWSRVKVRDYCAQHGWKARVVYQKECERAETQGWVGRKVNDADCTYPQTTAA